MMTETSEPKNKTWMQRWGYPLITGASVGFLVTFLALRFVGKGEVDRLSASNEIALLVAILYFVTAMAVLIGTVSPKFGEKFLNVEDADELGEQRSMLLYSGIAMALWGLALGTLALGGSGGVITNGPILLVAGLTLLIGYLFVFKSYQYSDELMNAVNTEATALSYFITFAVVGTWSVIAHAGYVSGPAPLDLLTLFYVVALVATLIAAGRRGMLARR